MAIAELFRKVGDFVASGFTPDSDPFDPYVDDPEDYAEDGYVEEGSALREIYKNPISSFMDRKKSNVIPMPGTKRDVNEVVLVEPRSFDDAAAIVQHLKEAKIVMVNLHLLDNSQSQRTIDFVCGASQALNGQPKKVGDGVFVFAPSNVSLSDMTTQQTKLNDTMWRTSLQ